MKKSKYVKNSNGVLIESYRSVGADIVTNGSRKYNAWQGIFLYQMDPILKEGFKDDKEVKKMILYGHRFSLSYNQLKKAMACVFYANLNPLEALYFVTGPISELGHV